MNVFGCLLACVKGTKANKTAACTRFVSIRIMCPFLQVGQIRSFADCVCISGWGA